MDKQLCTSFWGPKTATYFVELELSCKNISWQQKAVDGKIWL
jgi:hypothetical protein